MTVAGDIRNLEDMLLLPAGTELTGRHIRILRSWGIERVPIQCPGASGTDGGCEKQLSPELVATLEAELAPRFWQYNPADAVQRELLRLMAERRARLIPQAS